jgi:hypothetical protein
MLKLGINFFVSHSIAITYILKSYKKLCYFLEAIKVILNADLMSIILLKIPQLYYLSLTLLDPRKDVIQQIDL